MCRCEATGANAYTLAAAASKLAFTVALRSTETWGGAVNAVMDRRLLLQHANWCRRYKTYVPLTCDLNYVGQSGKCFNVQLLEHKQKVEKDLMVSWRLIAQNANASLYFI